MNAVILFVQNDDGIGENIHFDAISLTKIVRSGIIIRLVLIRGG